MNYFSVVLPDTILRNDTPYTGGRVNITVATNNCARIAYRIAANFDIIAEHRAEFLDAGLHLFRPVVDDYQLLIALHIAGDGTRSHMAVVAEDTVTDVIVMWGLYVIEQNHVLQFYRIPYYAVRADKS